MLLDDQVRRDERDCYCNTNMNRINPSRCSLRNLAIFLFLLVSSDPGGYQVTKKNDALSFVCLLQLCDRLMVVLIHTESDIYCKTVYLVDIFHSVHTSRFERNSLIHSDLAFSDALRIL